MQFKSFSSEGHMSRILFAAMAIITYSVPAVSQAITALAHGSPQSEARTQDQRISVSFSNTPLSDAIWTVSRRAGVRITFDRTVLPSKRVTYRAEGASPEAVLSNILSGTGFKAARASSGTL